MKHKVYLTREKRGLGQLSARLLIVRALNAALLAEKIEVPCEVSVLLTDDEGIHRLNKEFRNVDSATDVLSFPANEFAAGGFAPELAERNPKTGRAVLGDMALSLERASSQGEEFGHGTKREIQYLTVHSVLHLLGYDHVDEGEGKRVMREREKEIMARIEGVREE
ncbi:MAG: rRNA maturation RNase YbeY [Clostridia bacterium]|nr:rRNA maturation RNase YbeY [Clostridia bacterium]